MNNLISSKVFVVISLASLVLSVAVYSYVQDVFGQANQSELESTNTTRTDFEGLMSNLISARQGILNNDSASAYGAVNAAGADLFGLRQLASGDNETLAKQLTKELRPVRSGLDNTRDALREDNSTQALRSLNAAEFRVLKAMEGLPSGELPSGEEDVD